MRAALRTARLRVLTTLTFCQLIHSAYAGPLEYRTGSNFTVSEDSVLRNQTVYKPLFPQHSNSTPKFNPDALPQIDQPSSESLRVRDVSSAGLAFVQEEGTCAPGYPCVNGACCSGETGLCGYGPNSCGSDVCISNCDAQAQCGPYAPSGESRCPLNVCCSIYGFCGATDDFCIDKCDDTVSDCGPAPEPQGKSPGLVRTIGYYESWATTRPCDKVFPDDLDLLGLTHMNFAFAFFHPVTFQMMAMDANAQSQLRDFTAIKRKSRKLQTWIAIGGWSFNDPGNSPDTRTAFSDMASTSANRAVFIKSLIHFMDNYGFNGADIDWEYPGAEDRGGRPEDKENFVLLCREMKQAFAGQYGLSVTLPASFWYLKHFDVAKMEPHIDWFNIMSYDIHGVWDADNEFTGPYARPHTNLTQIDQALSLLWRAGVSASSVTLGLAYYGRSFTLADPSCTHPGCRFTEGGKAGACSKAAGVLTLAEIERIRATKDVSEYSDTKAAVKWMTWDSDQWVSYEDDTTFQMKIDYAKKKGLGGTMIWAVDQGVQGGSSDDNSLKKAGMFIEFNSLGMEDSEIVNFEKAKDAQDSCYVSLCGMDCRPGYTRRTLTRGSVGSLGPETSCHEGFQWLCCTSGTTLGTCDWYGYRGQGMRCSGGCPDGYTSMTQNTNRYKPPRAGNHGSDETCSGGYMTYCCDNFKPSLDQAKDSGLIMPEDIFQPGDLTRSSKVELSSCVTFAYLVAGKIYPLLSSAGMMQNTGGSTGIGFIAGSIASVVCLRGITEASTIWGYGHSMTTRSGGTGGVTKTKSKSSKTKTQSKGTKIKGGKMKIGRYDISVYTASDKTCSVSYTCMYGIGFDQVCDNQRYAINEILGGRIFYTYAGPRNIKRWKDEWYDSPHPHWRGSFSDRISGGGRPRCEGDEFPMASLEQSGPDKPQAVRAIDGNENGRQGNDFGNWIRAVYNPCAELLGADPMIQWRFNMDALPANDERKNPQHTGVIKKYGFDSISGREPCFATFTSANGQKSTVLDHGFRVHSSDPLFTRYHWTSQNYKGNPLTKSKSDLPTNQASGSWLKRDLEFQYATMTTEQLTVSTLTCTTAQTPAITVMTTTTKQAE